MFIMTITDDQIQKQYQNNITKYDTRYCESYPEKCIGEYYDTEHYQITTREYAKEDLEDEEEILEKDILSETI